MKIHQKVLGSLGILGFCIAAVAHSAPQERQFYSFYDDNGVLVGAGSQGCNSARLVTWGTVTANYTVETQPCWSLPIGQDPDVPCNNDPFACTYNN
jgi:hypothetical protein